MHLRFSSLRPWQPLSDAEWRVLARFVAPPGRGRPPIDHRTRLAGVFLVALTGMAWADLPAWFGPGETLRRQFHRWATQGLFDTLLLAALDPKGEDGAVLRGMEPWLCAAYRRAIPLRGTAMAELLGYGSALREVDLRRLDRILSAARHKPLIAAGMQAALPRSGVATASRRRRTRPRAEGSCSKAAAARPAPRPSAGGADRPGGSCPIAARPAPTGILSYCAAGFA
jgi:transposase